MRVKGFQFTLVPKPFTNPPPQMYRTAEQASKGMAKDRVIGALWHISDVNFIDSESSWNPGQTLYNE